MKRLPLPTQEELNRIFSYSEDSGNLFWNHNGQIAGSEVTFSHGKTYIMVFMNGLNYYAHRIIWKMLYNEEPEYIDHDDGDGTHNWKTNLNKSNKYHNNHNRKLPSNNKSGCPGVTWAKANKKWKAQIDVYGIRLHLGYFESLQDAIKTRKEAEITYGFNKNHGTVRPL